jgi:hypothetical protein
MQHVKSVKIECLSSEDIILQILDLMIHFILSYVLINLYIANFQWFQPPNQKSIGEPKNAWSKIGAP